MKVLLQIYVPKPNRKPPGYTFACLGTPQTSICIRILKLMKVIVNKVLEWKVKKKVLLDFLNGKIIS